MTKTLRERLASRLVRMGYTYAEFHGWSTEYMEKVVAGAAKKARSK